jgi:hypothetical protein
MHLLLLTTYSAPPGPTGKSTLTREGDLVLGPLLQQQLAAAVKEEHAEGPVQQPLRLCWQEPVAVVLVCAACYNVISVHQDAVVLQHKVLLAAMRCGRWHKQHRRVGVVGLGVGGQ